VNWHDKNEGNNEFHLDNPDANMTKQLAITEKCMIGCVNIRHCSCCATHHSASHLKSVVDTNQTLGRQRFTVQTAEMFFSLCRQITKSCAQVQSQSDKKKQLCRMTILFVILHPGHEWCIPQISQTHPFGCELEHGDLLMGPRMKQMLDRTKESLCHCF